MQSSNKHKSSFLPPLDDAFFFSSGAFKTGSDFLDADYFKSRTGAAGNLLAAAAFFAGAGAAAFFATATFLGSAFTFFIALAFSAFGLGTIAGTFLAI